MHNKLNIMELSYFQSIVIVIDVIRKKGGFLCM